MTTDDTAPQVKRVRYCAPHLGRRIWDAVSGTL